MVLMKSEDRRVLERKQKKGNALLKDRLCFITLSLVSLTQTPLLAPVFSGQDSYIETISLKSSIQASVRWVAL